MKKNNFKKISKLADDVMTASEHSLILAQLENKEYKGDNQCYKTCAKSSGSPLNIAIMIKSFLDQAVEVNVAFHLLNSGIAPFFRTEEINSEE